MRAVVQRVSRASVAVEREVVASIGPGLLVLLGATHDDTEGDARAMGQKIAGLRIFSDGNGHMNVSVSEVAGEVLVVSQFTLYGDVARGRRPSFTTAAGPEVAAPLVELVAAAIEEQGIPVSRGKFGAMMEVELTNDGPVTILLESKDGRVR